MISPRTAISALISISLLGLSLLAAAPAQAAATPSTIYADGCPPAVPVITSASGGGGSPVSSISWTSERDTLVIFNGNTCALRVDGFPSGGLAFSQTISPTLGASITIDPLGTRVIRLEISNVSGTATITMVPPGGGGGGSDSTVTSSLPAPITQQFGKPASLTCDAVQPEGLNWGGAESGGWSESWAQWMNAGSGGAVCTRTLIYSNTSGNWVAQ